MAEAKGQGEEAPRRLPAFEVYTEQMKALLMATAAEAALKLDVVARDLRGHRQRIEPTNTEKFQYASAIIESTAPVRDAFFDVMEKLVDRHATDLARIKALQIMIELSAIEGSMQGEVPLGVTAFAALNNMMNGVPDLFRIFVRQCFAEPMTPVIQNMSKDFLKLVVGFIAQWTDSNKYPDELALAFKDCAMVFASLYATSIQAAQSWWQSASENPNDWAANKANSVHNDAAKVVTFMCRSPDTVKMVLPDLPIVIYNKMPDLNAIRGLFMKKEWIFPPFRVATALASASAEASHFFAGPEWSKVDLGATAYAKYSVHKKTLKHQRMTKYLIAQLWQLLYEEKESIGEPVKMAYNASMLFAIMRHSKQAVSELMDEYKMYEPRIRKSMESNGNMSPFALQLLKRALEYAQSCGIMSAACLEGVLLCVRMNPTSTALDDSDLLYRYRQDMEFKFDDAVRMIQEISQKLLTTPVKQQTEGTKIALNYVLEIMMRYNFNEKSETFNDDLTKNYDREAICFKVLNTDSKVDFIDDEVRLGAAKTLATLKLEEFSQQEIQQLVELFATIPAILPVTRYQVLCNLQYFMFKLALYDREDEEEKEGAKHDKSKAVNFPGKVFRSLYAPEVSATIFSLLERLVLDSSPESASYWELRFMQSCVKFLMTGWVKLEFHADNLGRRPVDILAAVVDKEQQRIVDLGNTFAARKDRYYKLIEQRRCVVSEDSLDTSFSGAELNSYRLPDIRLAKYKDVKLSEVFYQHTFLEQTSLGARVANLAPVVVGLRRVDIVAFRVIHQLANLIEGITFVSSVTNLAQVTFNEWNKYDPGKPVAECDRDERLSFGATRHEGKEGDSAEAAAGLGTPELKEAPGAAPATPAGSAGAAAASVAAKAAAKPAAEKHRSGATKGNSELVEVRTCTGDQTENHQIMIMHNNYFNSIHKPEKKRVALPDKANGALTKNVVIKDLLQDERNVVLAARIGTKIVAFIAAVPEVELSPTSAFGKPTTSAIILLYCHHPDLLAEVRAVQVELLACLSHNLWVRGFQICRLNADRYERQLVRDMAAVLDESGRPPMPASKAAVAAQAAAEAEDAARRPAASEGKAEDVELSGLGAAAADGQGSPGASESSKDKDDMAAGVRTMYKWSLDANIYRFNREHTYFMEQKIAQSLLQLMLDDQQRVKIDEMKAQGKATSAKAAIQRFQSKIRQRMDEFAGTLTAHFEQKGHLEEDLEGQGGSGAAGGDGDDEHESNGVVRDGLQQQAAASDREMRFQGILEREFKNGMSLCIRTVPPVWEKVLCGTREETLVEAMTRVPAVSSTAPKPAIAAALLSQLPPDMNPRTNPDNFPNLWLTDQLEQALKDAADPLAAKNASQKGAKAATPSATTSLSYQREMEAEIKRRRNEYKLQTEARRLDRDEADKRAHEWDLPPVLQSWVVPASAAVLRMLFALLTRSQRYVFDDMCKSLSLVPARGLGLLEALRAVLNSFQYQMRASVLEQFPAANYGIGIKVLLVLEQSFVDVPAGLESSVVALEYYELCLEIIKDIAANVLGLLESRNSSFTSAAAQGTAVIPEKSLEGGSTGPKGELHPEEERLVCQLVRTMTVIMNQVGRICLFVPKLSKDTKPANFHLIAEGTRMCRAHAQQQLFTKSRLITDVVMAILLYDLEKENEVEPRKKASDAVKSKLEGGGSSPVSRDTMRVHATSLLAHFVQVDDEYRFRFFNEFCVSSIQAERSLRASLIQRVLGLSAQLRFRARLEPFLRQTEVLAADEFIVTSLFVEHGTCRPVGINYPGVKLLIITNKAYYFSVNSFAWNIEDEILQHCTADKLIKFGQLVCKQFKDIIRMYRDISGQVMAIRSFAEPGSLRIGQMAIRRETDVFLNRGQGVIDSVLFELTRRARDDANRVATVAFDEFTPQALPLMLNECASEMARMTPRIMTYVHVVKRDQTVAPRVMMWVSMGETGAQYIVISPYSLRNWEPHLAGEDDDDIVAAPEWRPAQVATVDGGARKEGGIDKKKLEENLNQFKGLFAVPPPSSLPGFMNALPAMPIGNLGNAAPFYVPVSEVQSVDFTEDSDTDMIIRIRRIDPSRIPSVYVRFTDDTSREMWRRKLKELFFGGSFGVWQENLLPDLSDNSRRKEELL